MNHDYWICDATTGGDVKNWFGVVDERAGGIIAYFSNEEDATKFINAMMVTELAQ